MRRFLLLITAAACGNDPVDDVIGAACIDDRDCAERCERGADFPGGFCTLSCRDDLDCTSDSICADTHGGICLFPCSASVDCELLGPPYFCRERRDFFDRTIFVCMSD